MKVHPDRLLQLLAPQGYVLSFFEKATNTVMYVRHSPFRDCFEQIGLAGSVDGAYVSASVRVSIVPGGAQWRNTFDEQHLSELGGPTGYAKLLRSAEAMRWEHLLSESAPRRNRALAERHALDLLRRTAKARQAARFYLAFLPDDVHNLESFWHGMRAAATITQQEQAKRMLRFGLLTIPYNTEAEKDRVFFAYQIVAYTIVLKAESAVPNGYFSADSDAYQDHDLACCFQIMASRIYRERGWELVDGGES